MRPVFGIGSRTPYEAAIWENNPAANPKLAGKIGSDQDLSPLLARPDLRSLLGMEDTGPDRVH
jgi:hypothetical protein